MGALQDNVSLLVAGLDLALVQSVLSAIRTADLSRVPLSPNTPAATTLDTNRPATTVARDARGLRYCDQPAATFHPAAAHRDHPKLRELLPYVCIRPVEPVRHESTIQPPWKVLPWPEKIHRHSVRCHQPVKILPNRVDVTVAGRTLDLFV